MWVAEGENDMQSLQNPFTTIFDLRKERDAFNVSDR